MMANLFDQVVSKCVLMATAALLVAPVAAQTYHAPRLPGGHPDLNGIWQALNEANYDLQAHIARPAMALRAGPYGPVPAPPALALGAVGSVPPSLGVVEGGEIPYKPEALKTKQENAKDWINRDPEIKCYLPGVPRATYMPYPFQIVQSTEALTLVYEYAGAVRNIFLKDPGPAPADSWMGQSFAHWEGETLVITVTDMNENTWLDRAGDFHSDKLKVTERYTRTSPNTIAYEATMDDPETFTRPWKIDMTLYKRTDTQILDFKCAEFIEEMLYGPYRKHPLGK